MYIYTHVAMTQYVVEKKIYLNGMCAAKQIRETVLFNRHKASPVDITLSVTHVLLNERNRPNVCARHACTKWNNY